MSNLLDGDTTTVAIASVLPTLVLAVVVVVARRAGLARVAADALKLRRKRG